eukprot:GHVR01041849.1.p1 GENE.GHVR01041849.1~~GHVR01041849.1.p1  ORF type:complete len:354 (-),score=46.62 GHVR01041849.1:488-1549(-)
MSDPFLYSRFMMNSPEESPYSHQEFRPNAPSQVRDSKSHHEILLDRPERHKQANARQTAMNIVKAFIGCAFLFLPHAYANGGIILSNVIMIASFVLNCYCMLRLIKCTSIGGDTFGDIAYHSFGVCGRGVVNFSLWLSQMSFFSVLLIFVAKNISDIIRTLSSCAASPVSVPMIIFFMIPLYSGLGLVRRLKQFNPLILMADICVAISIVLIFILVYIKLYLTGPQPVVYINRTRWPLFIGAASYCWEGVGVVLPIRNAMQDHIKHQFPVILSACMLGICVLFLIYASSSYVAYGKVTQEVILFNLPPSLADVSPESSKARCGGCSGCRCAGAVCDIFVNRWTFDVTTSSNGC